MLPVASQPASAASHPATAANSPAATGLDPGASALAIQAEVLAGLLDAERQPARWRAPGFSRQVDLVRAQLRPIRSLESLEHSYSREGFHLDRAGTAPPSPDGLLRSSATDVAYAHRWLELSGRRGEGPWVTLLGEA